MSQDQERLRRQTLVRNAVRMALVAGAALSVLAALLASTALAISILLGTLLACINFVLLARGVSSAIDRTVAAVEAVEEARGLERGEGQLEPEEVVDRPYNASSFLRLIFFVGVVGALMWLPPKEPMGLAIGVIVVLIAASLAMLADHRAHAGAIGSERD